MAMYNMIIGINLTIDFLEMFFNFTSEEVDFLDTDRTLFVFVELGTVFTALIVLFSDFVKTNARFTGLPTCEMCQGPKNCIMVKRGGLTN